MAWQVPSSIKPLELHNSQLWHRNCLVIPNVCPQRATRNWAATRGNEMSEETKIESIATEQKTRRTAIKTAAQVAVTAPAVGLLLSASSKSASAATLYGSNDNDAIASDD